MNTAYILLSDKNLEQTLFSILEILGILPVIIDLSYIVKNSNKDKKKLLFTDYLHTKENNVKQYNFENIVIITPLSKEFLAINKYQEHIIYFNIALTINSIKDLLQDLYVLK